MSNQPTNLVTYHVDPDAKTVSRTQSGNTDTVADYDPTSGILELREEWRNYRTAIIKHLNDKGWTYTGLTSQKPKPGAPKRPRQNPRLGDKTPAYVQWLAEWHRDEFLQSFGVKELQVRTGWDEWVSRIRNDDGHWVEVPQKEPIYQAVDGLNYDVEKLLDGSQRLVAARQCAITHKTAKGHDDEIYDWDADATVDDRSDSNRRIRG